MKKSTGLIKTVLTVVSALAGGLVVGLGLGWNAAKRRIADEKLSSMVDGVESTLRQVLAARDISLSPDSGSRLSLLLARIWRDGGPDALELLSGLATRAGSAKTEKDFIGTGEEKEWRGTVIQVEQEMNKRDKARGIEETLP